MRDSDTVRGRLSPRGKSVQQQWLGFVIGFRRRVDLAQIVFALRGFQAIRRQELLSQGERLHEERFGVGIVIEALVELRFTVQSLGKFGGFRAVQTGIDLQSLFVQRQCLGVPAFGSIDLRQVENRARRSRVLGRKGGGKLLVGKQQFLRFGKVRLLRRSCGGVLAGYPGIEGRLLCGRLLCARLLRKQGSDSEDRDREQTATNSHCQGFLNHCH